jgi:hypothetical protein
MPRKNHCHPEVVILMIYITAKIAFEEHFNLFMKGGNYETPV